MLGQPAWAVQRGGVRGTTDWKPGTGVGPQLHGGLSGHTLDLSIARNIRLGGARQLQLRLDAFNALNTVVYNGRVTQLQLNSPTDQRCATRSICRTGRSIRIA